MYFDVGRPHQAPEDQLAYGKLAKSLSIWPGLREMAKLLGTPNMSVYEGWISVGKTNNYGILLLDGTEAISPPETSH